LASTEEADRSAAAKVQAQRIAVEARAEQKAVPDPPEPAAESADNPSDPTASPQPDSTDLANARAELEFALTEAEQASAELDLVTNALRLARARRLQRQHGLDATGDPSGLSALLEDVGERLAANNAEVSSRQATESAAVATLEQVIAEQGPEGADVVEQTRLRDSAQEAVRLAQAEVTKTAEDSDRLRDAADILARIGAGEVELPAEYTPPSPDAMDLDSLPNEVELGRTGLAGELEVIECGVLDRGRTLAFFREHCPRVELIEPRSEVPDNATVDSINEADNDFMRGIFHYAGLEPDEWQDLFQQNDRTTKRLSRASVVLNQTLSDSWSAGKGLEFHLDHNESAIDLKIDDPSVAHRFVRASRRSSGFTHFFSLKTVLFAREKASGASQFIWLFDEPGVFLHPDGQRDLLQEFETLARSNQLIYATHSVFLINKNYPARHRLIVKDDRGTVVDQKPFTGRWRAALDALGLSFPGSLLFATRVLLVEGDSDPILINADLQKLIEFEVLTVDLNQLSPVATGDSKHTDALIRILYDAPERPQIAVLFDNDKGGRLRLKNLKKLIQALELPNEILPEGTSVEDFVLAPELFRDATIGYLERMKTDEAARLAIRSDLAASYAERFSDQPPVGLAAWSRDEGKRVLGDEPSSVGIAREYVGLLAEASRDQCTGIERAKQLSEIMLQMLPLPSQVVEEPQILAP
jgi:hypothetical protein